MDAHRVLVAKLVQLLVDDREDAPAMGNVA